MAWCPKCKYEFREGITVCSDCGCELVDDLSLVCDKNENIEEIDEADIAEAVILSQEEFFYDEEELPKYEHHEVYVNNEEKAEDNKSSAFTLLLVGGIGLIFIICFFLGIIPSNMNAFSRYMISGVMGAMFILFIVMGIVSMNKFIEFKRKATKENIITEEIKKWTSDNITKDMIDSKLEFNDESDELKYFERTKILKSMIEDKFMNLDNMYLDRLIDDLYTEVFEIDK